MFKNAREIPFAPGYFADTDGEIYNGRGRKLAKYKGKYGTYSTKIKADGVFKSVDVGTIMKETFFKKLPPGYVLWHKNGMRSDFQLGNLEAISRTELCLRAGKNGGKRAVAKIDQAGNVAEIYRSAAEAARKNYYTTSTICKHCNGEIRRATDGCKYVWAEEIENENIEPV